MSIWKRLVRAQRWNPTLCWARILTTTDPASTNPTGLDLELKEERMTR